MNVSLNTTIGIVRVETHEEHIEIFTPEEPFKNGVVVILNLHRLERDATGLKPKLQDLIDIATYELGGYFEEFKVLGIS